MTYNNMPIELFQKLKKRSRTKFTLIHTCALTITKLQPETAIQRCACAYRTETRYDRDIIVNKVKAQGDMPAYGYLHRILMAQN